MNITLVDTTQKRNAQFVPLALLRLSAAHKYKGDAVELVPAGKMPKKKPDIIYFSLIFLFDYLNDIQWILAYNKRFPAAKIIVGGVSVSLIDNKFEAHLKHKKNIELFFGRDLELEQFTPDFELTGLNYSYGFTSRGCPNRCEWCVVPILEGKQHIIENWTDAIDTDKKVFLGFDNNFLACGSKHVESVLKYLSENNIKVDFNQGMDAEILHKNKKLQDIFLRYSDVWHYMRFAWDSDRVKDSILFVLDFLHNNDFQTSCGLYMLYDTDDKPEAVFERIKTILNHPHNVGMKLMRFKDLNTGVLLRKWGGIGDLFADACAFSVTGIITRGIYWNFMFEGDLNDFLQKAGLIRQYCKTHKKKQSSEFIDYVRKRLNKNVDKS